MSGSGGSIGHAGDSGATPGGGGLGSAGDAPAEGIPGASSFTRFDLYSLTDTVTGSNGECRTIFPEGNDPLYPSVWSFNRASRLLSWDFCDTSSHTMARGTDTLSDVDYQAVMSLVAAMQPKPSSMCLGDASHYEFTLDHGGTTSRYTESLGFCGPVPSNETLVEGVYALVNWLLSNSPPHP
ncbi:MAG TPA: hypothetical protein VGC79_17110 [Polyangiaceae bacterium]